LLARIVLCATALAGVVLGTPAWAQDAPPRISTTEAQLLATFNEPGTHDPYWVITLQHFSTWAYGSNFFFLDLTDSPDLDFYADQPGLYLEYAPVLSLGALGVLSPGEGAVLRDVGVTAQINAGWTSGGFPIDRVYLEGVELAWSVPGFAAFNTQLLARQEHGYDPSWQFTWVYAPPFVIGPADGVVSGFLDVWRRDGEEVEGSTVVLAQPQVLFTLGSPEPGESFLQLGAELEPSRDFPTPLNEGWNLAVSPMLRWVF
jgi:hypothetical protein